MKKITLIIPLAILILILAIVNFRRAAPTPPSTPSSTFDAQHSDIITGNTHYFGNEAVGDLNRDGLDDVAFLVTETPGGTGVFYYAVVALQTETGYKTTNTFLIGDRIAPQSTEITAGELHINFAERKPGEPMTTPPSQGAVLLLKVTPAGVLEGLMK